MRAARLSAVVLLAIGTILVPAARADALHIDFDGDGIPDRIDVASPSTELVVLLSKTPGLQRLAAGDLIVRLVVADVDRDGDPDLLATTHRTGLQIWINTPRGLLVARAPGARPLQRGTGAIGSGVPHRSADDSTCNDQTRELVEGCSSRGQPTLSSRRVAAPPLTRESRYEHLPRIARGPPSDSPRPHTSVA
jgi:hypothetical protein